jgi:aspartate/methionine/tyrosine aminotransferase
LLKRSCALYHCGGATIKASGINAGRATTIFPEEEKMFSRLTTQLHGESNSLYRLRGELQSQGCLIRDLISGNINEQGFEFPQNLLESALVRGSRSCRIYKPDSFGQKPAREAISEYYRESGCKIDPDCILLTPGTSLSYWYCFKLLADEGDEILCPCPSYPLFDYIALLSGVKLIPYKLQEERNWAIDIDQLEACISTRTRALVLISPHNPTGHVSSSEEIAALTEIARRHDLAIISDEVFSDYLLQGDRLPRPADADAPLVCTLNGFSKMFALPGIKFGWMAVSGNPEKVQKALHSLELISDTFLPVNEIVQAAAPDILNAGKAVRNDFAGRIRECWRITKEQLDRSQTFQYTMPDGGFYATLSLNNLSEEQAAEAILKEKQILIHPGYFYDMASNHLILCFVHRSETLQSLLPELIETLDRLTAKF